jgi:hypothetical protein
MPRARPLLLASLVLAAACSRREPAKPLAKDEIDAPRDTGPTRAEAAVGLARLAVTHADFARLVLYTWTSPEQIADLRKDGLLLVKDGSTTPSGFQIELDALWRAKTKGSDLAAIFSTHPGLAKHRYAWTAPFATRRTLNSGDDSHDHDATYGDALIRVVLREDAYVGRFDASLVDPWTFFDMKRHSIPTAAIVADPSHVGAIYHVATDPSHDAYREYVLCNESMIDEWSVGTEKIRAEVLDEIAMLTGLSTLGLDVPAATPLLTLSASWPAVKPTASLEDDWSAAIAFGNKRYLPTKKNLGDIAFVMDSYDPTPPAIVARSKATFPIGSLPRPPAPTAPLRPKKRVW